MKNILSILALFTMCTFNLSAQHNHEHRVPAKGMAAINNAGVFAPLEFDRHPVGDNDILIEIMYSGICHSDIHHVLEDWRKETYPLVPGHEMAGRVTQVGKNVTKFKVGDYAGVGCMVNSCGECDHCKAGEEQYCENGRVLTYGAKDIYHNNEMTQGGYANNMVVSELFAIKIPENADMEKVAPLLCAGITTYSPLKYTNVKKGDKVGVAGFGGLGHMAVKYAVSLGAQVTVFDITESKRQDALDMGAVKYVNVNNPQELEGLNSSLDVIVSTIPTKYDPRMYVNMLKIDGSLAVVGLPANRDTPSIDLSTLVFLSRRKIFGSQIGGIRETQEMLDYSVKNNIYPQVEIIEPSQIEEAYKKVIAGEVHFRYVIDMSKL